MLYNRTILFVDNIMLFCAPDEARAAGDQIRIMDMSASMLGRHGFRPISS